MHTFAMVTLAGLALAAAPTAAQAQQKYPSKPIRMVIGTVAGSQPDGLARMIGQKMTERWGQPVVIDNRPGGSGTIAGAQVAKATPDGHTLLYAIPNFLISVALQPSVPYDPFKDFAGVTQLGMTTNVLVSSPSLPVKSVKDLVAHAKAQPGKLIFASSATGSASHLTGARLNHLTGIKVVHVAFRGGPEGMIEVLAGRAHYHIGTMGVTLPFIKEGKLVGLGVTTPQRAPVLPDVPALGEVLADFKRPETTHGLLAPGGTPRPIIDQLNKEIARIFELPDVKERVQAIAYVTAPTTPEEYEKIRREQIAGLSKLVRDAGLRPK